MEIDVLRVTVKHYNLFCHLASLQPYHLATLQPYMMHSEYARRPNPYAQVHGKALQPALSPYNLTTLQPYHLTTLSPYHLTTLPTRIEQITS